MMMGILFDSKGRGVIIHLFIVKGTPALPLQIG